MGTTSTMADPLSHFLSGSRVPPVISHYALATNGDANSVPATAAFLGSGKKVDGTERERGGGREGKRKGRWCGSSISESPQSPAIVRNIMNAGVYLDEWLQSEGWYCRLGVKVEGGRMGHSAD